MALAVHARDDLVSHVLQEAAFLESGGQEQQAGERGNGWPVHVLRVGRNRVGVEQAQAEAEQNQKQKQTIALQAGSDFGRDQQQASHRGLSGLGANCTSVMWAPARTVLPACSRVVRGPSTQEAAVVAVHAMD